MTAEPKPVFRELVEADKPEWLELWAGYLEFYNHELSADQTELTWQRFFDEKYNLWGFVAVADDKLVGLAHCSFTNSTWSITSDLYLEDLFVAPGARGQGIGAFLIESCADFGRELGANCLHWQTHRDNAQAQSVYKKVATQSDFVIYKKKL